MLFENPNDEEYNSLIESYIENLQDSDYLTLEESQMLLEIKRSKEMKNKFKEIKKDGAGIAGVTYLNAYLTDMYADLIVGCKKKIKKLSGLDKKINWNYCCAKACAKVVDEINKQIMKTEKIKDPKEKALAKKAILKHYKKWLNRYVNYQRKTQSYLAK